MSHGASVALRVSSARLLGQDNQDIIAPTIVIAKRAEVAGAYGLAIAKI
jgi:hypothetical protein